MTEDELYELGERNKKILNKWVKKYCTFQTADDLVKIEKKWLNSKDFEILVFDEDDLKRWSNERYFRQFMMWQCVYSIDTKEKQDIFMEFLSNFTCAKTIIRELCLVWTPDYLLEHYTYDNKPWHKGTQYYRLKAIVNVVKENKISFKEHLGYYGGLTHYYTDRFVYDIVDEKCIKKNGLPYLEVYRYFEKCDDYITYRNNDLTKTDLYYVRDLKYDFSNCKTDKTTVLPKQNDVEQ